MNGTPGTLRTVLSPPALDTPDAAEARLRLDGLSTINEDLGRELLRCYEQLSLVYEITEHIANLQEPEDIQAALLRRFGAMLSAGAVYFEHAGTCVSVECGAALARPVEIAPHSVASALESGIKHVRRTRRTHVPELPRDAAAALRGARVLLGAMRPTRFGATTPDVVIALRDEREAPFDSGDVLASEAVLGYGGHILGNVLMLRSLKHTAVETVTALANAIDAKDNYTSGHSGRVGWLARLTGQALGLPASELQVLEWAGLLHDVGKIGISEHILNKPGKLTPEEFEEMKRHPRLSYEVLKPVASLEPVLKPVLHHHENHDGSGYPDGLRGAEIPLGAQIIHVVDIFDALTSTRSYRRGFELERALSILLSDSGRVTEPHVTDVFIRAFRQYMREQPVDFQRRFAHIASAPAARAAPAGNEAPCEPPA